MLKELVEMMEERLYMIHEVKNVKFLKIINPVENNRIEFFITCNNEADTLQVSAEIKHKEETFAKLNLLLTEWHP